MTHCQNCIVNVKTESLDRLLSHFE